MEGGPVTLNIWVLPCEFGIFDGQRESQGTIKFWKNGEAVLEDYSSDFIADDVPSDLIFLNAFLEERGWIFKIGNDLRDGHPDVWNRIISIVFDMTVDDVEVEDDIEIDEDMDFVEFEKNLSQYRRANKKKRIEYSKKGKNHEHKEVYNI
jgi:hypothetical protein